jgi:putative transposase
MVSAPARRQQVAYARGRGVSSRRACVLLSVARSTLTYRSRRADQDRPVLTAMRGLAAQYPRYGYRRIRILSRVTQCSPRRVIENSPPRVRWWPRPA